MAPLLTRLLSFVASACSLPDSSVHRILQARILEWGATSYFRRSSQSTGDSPVQETQEIQVWSLGWEDLLEYKIATTPEFLPGKPHDRGACLATVHGVARIRSDWVTEHTHAAHLIVSFPCGSPGKESACNAGDLGSIPRLGRSPREGKGYPLQHSGLETPQTVLSMGSRRVRHDWTIFTLNVSY